MNTQKPINPVPQNPDGSYTIYQENSLTVTLTFPTPPAAGFRVVSADTDPGLPSGYTWVKNFGIQNSAGQYLPSVTYRLQGSTPPRGRWVVYFGPGDIRDLNGTHSNVPGDPPIGYG